MKKHFKIRVSGRVQGVYFRASAKEKARSLNISGYVMNEPDGSVYIEAEGGQQDIEKFLEWCRKGPPHAKVSQCEIQEGPLKNFSGFVIQM